jgi:hypothetical protein
MQDVPLTFDFRILTGYEYIIIVADWIYQNSPVTPDYKKMTLQVTKLVTFLDETLTTLQRLKNSTSTYYRNLLVVQFFSSGLLLILT